MGIAMPASSLPTGSTPILFSCGAAPAAFCVLIRFNWFLSFVFQKKDAASQPRLFGIYFFSSPVASWVR